jgi:hypothetical protein
MQTSVHREQKGTHLDHWVRENFGETRGLNRPEGTNAPSVGLIYETLTYPPFLPSSLLSNQPD